MEVPQNGWFVWRKSHQNWWFGGTPIFLEPPTSNGEYDMSWPMSKRKRILGIQNGTWLIREAPAGISPTGCRWKDDPIIHWLVVGPPLWRIWTSIWMIRIPIYGKIKLMFQTTNQLYVHPCQATYSLNMAISKWEKQLTPLVPWQLFHRCRRRFHDVGANLHTLWQFQTKCDSFKHGKKKKARRENPKKGKTR